MEVSDEALVDLDAKDFVSAVCSLPEPVRPGRVWRGYGFWETILALLIHLVPTGLVLVALAIAWRWDWAGTILFRRPWNLVSGHGGGTTPVVGVRGDFRTAVPGRCSVPGQLAVPKEVQSTT